jgi:hypothetical protein
VAKAQLRSNKEARKPKKAKAKTIAANPSQKGGRRGPESLEHLKNRGARLRGALYVDLLHRRSGVRAG